MIVTGRCHDQRMEPSRSLEPLRGRPLRYLLTVLLSERGPLGVAELADAVEHEGFALEGRPSKLVSDALRWEIIHGRVVKTGRGHYAPGQMPKQTRHWIRRRVEQARASVKNVAPDRIGDGDPPKS
jgi:hypothetical protein